MEARFAGGLRARGIALTERNTDGWRVFTMSDTPEGPVGPIDNERWQDQDSYRDEARPVDASEPPVHDEHTNDDGYSDAEAGHAADDGFDQHEYPVEETRRSRARSVALLASVVVAALLIGLMIWRPWTSKTTQTAPTPSASPTDVVTSPPSVKPTNAAQETVLTHPSQMFKAGNVYTPNISKAPMAKNSAGMVTHLDGQVKEFFSGYGTLNFDQYHGTLWVAGPKTKKITIKYDNCQNKGKGDETPLFTGAKYFVDVPVPANAVPAKGTDGQVAIWSPSEDKLWELWVASKKKGVWYACWGGRIDNVSKSQGQMPYGYGASASGLAVTGSMISVEEAKALKIEHAMGLNIPEPANWPNFWYPANRTDGWSKDPNALPEGARLRLDPSIDVDSLEMTPLAKAIAKAAQQYGFIVTDKAGAVAVVTEGGERRMVNSTGKSVAPNPWGKVLNGVGAENVLKGFPWDKLQVIQKDWGQPAGYQNPAKG